MHNLLEKNFVTISKALTSFICFRETNYLVFNDNPLHQLKTGNLLIIIIKITCHIELGKRTPLITVTSPEL